MSGIRWPRKSALIIANSLYTDPILRQLVAPAQDAEALARVLRDPAISGFQVQTVLNRPRYRVEEVIEAFFLDRDRDDLLLLYFSGHGLTDEDGLLYYAARNTYHDRLRSTAVAASFVNESMTKCRSRRQVLLLDCCHSGAFARTKAGPAVNLGQHFGGMDTGRGRFILASSDAYQYSFEGDAVDGDPVCSVFTQALVEGLRTGDADLDGDGLVTLDELYDYIHRRVTDQTPLQSPRKWSYEVDGSLVIARSPRRVETPLPDDLRLAIDSFVPEAREAAIRRLDTLLRGKHRNLALAAHKALLSLADDDSRRVASTAQKCLAACSEQIRALEEQCNAVAVPTPVVSQPRSDEQRIESEKVSLEKDELYRQRLIARAPLKEEGREDVAAAGGARPEQKELKRHGLEEQARKDERNTPDSPETGLKIDGLAQRETAESAAECAAPGREEQTRTLLIDRKVAVLLLLAFVSVVFGFVVARHSLSPPESSDHSVASLPQADNVAPSSSECSSKSTPTSSATTSADLPTVQEMVRRADACYSVTNYLEAAHWYGKAAAEGDAYAEYNLGQIYMSGLGVTKDYAQAMQWYRKSAAQGNSAAESDLGYMYQFGLGVKKDYTQALQWYRKSADQGYPIAENNLAFMLDGGLGVKKDYAQAIQWYRKSADQGSATAEHNLGYMYRNGLGVERDEAQAQRWYQRAKADGFKE